MQLIHRILVIGALAWIGKNLFSKTDNRPKKELKLYSNCHDEFIQFNRNIEIPRDKIDNLIRAHQTIRSKIKKYIANSTLLDAPEFFIQGSYKTKTLIDNNGGKCDVDLGIVFPGKPQIKLSRLKNHLKNALISHTSKGVSANGNCISVNYVRDFHIDLPVFYQQDNQIYFGSKSGWTISDPKGFAEWFKIESRKNPQFKRIVRYLKAWASLKQYKTRIKMPSGLVLTIWARTFYIKSKYDDVSFVKTCSRILQYMDQTSIDNWKAIIPVPPRDNVINRLTYSQKVNFYEKFGVMVSYGIKAISQPKRHIALKYWSKIFGSKFSGYSSFRI